LGLDYLDNRGGNFNYSYCKIGANMLDNAYEYLEKLRLQSEWTTRPSYRKPEKEKLNIKVFSDKVLVEELKSRGYIVIKKYDD
jgi:hypothetical protein